MALEWSGAFQNTLWGDSPLAPFDIIGADGLGDIPEVVTSDRPRLRRHGVTAGDDFLGGRLFTIRFIIDSDTWADDLATLRRITSPCQDESEFLFCIPGIADMPETGGDWRRIMCRVRRRSIPTDAQYRMGFSQPEVQFYATDPRIYDSGHSAFLYLPMGSPGISFPIVPPLTFGGIAGSINEPVNNQGDFPTEWTATIRGPVQNPTILNDTTGELISFNLTLPTAADVLVVDSEARTVILNDTGSRYYTITQGSTWFDFPPGITSLRYSGINLGGEGSMFVQYRSAWV